MTTIQTTQDYSLFKIIKGNRKVRNAHVKRLAEAISKDPGIITYNPILINENAEIIDGQHRFEAIKSLSLPVYYIQVEGLGIEEVQILNSSSKVWSPVDYAQSYVQMGKKAYEFYLGLKSDFKLNHDILIRFIGLDRPVTTEVFKAGRLRATDIEKTVDLCLNLAEIGEFYPKYKGRTFAFAFKQLWESPLYDQKVMIEKMKKYGSKVGEYTEQQECFEALLKVYQK